MSITNTDKELLFKTCKESTEDVTGWKIFIFLPQNFSWRFIIVLSVIYSYTVNTINFFYQSYDHRAYIMSMMCDFLYFIDVVLATLHYFMINTRKLRHGRRRRLILLVFDYISLIPFSIILQYLEYRDGSTLTSQYQYLRINACIRIYQVYTYFCDIKFWIFKVKIYLIVTYLEVIVYILLITHLISCFLIFCFDDHFKKKCKTDIVHCIVENELTTFALMNQAYINPISKFPLEDYKIFIIAAFFIGYLIIFGYALPLFIFVTLKYLRQLFEFSNRFKQLKLLVTNLIEDENLKDKVLKYFHLKWTYGKGNRRPEILQMFPLSLQKSIFCDIHWDVFRHSKFLQGLSIGCKRSLALQMKTEFFNPKTILIQKYAKKLSLMYLESGLIQIMAEENVNCPVITFSSGTVLGEVPLFLQLESKACVRTAKFSIVHFLDFKDLFSVLSDYPKDRKKLFKNFKLRLNTAKSSYINKISICPLFLQNESSFSSVRKNIEGNIKWIKYQFRAVEELHQAQLAFKYNSTQENKINLQHQIQNLQTQLDHTTVNIPLLCINDEVMNKYDAVCLRMSFPWMADPQSNFLAIWNGIIIVFVLNATIVFPYFIIWFEHPPSWFLDISVVTTFLYVLDIIIQLFTAVRNKNVVVTKFWKVLSYRLASLSFYADILAALPLQIIAYCVPTHYADYVLNLFFCNALIKVYKLFGYLNTWNYTIEPNAVLRTYAKYIFLLAVSLYWTAAVLNLCGVKCLFYKCGEHDWFSVFKSSADLPADKYPSLLLSIFLGLDVPIENLSTDTFPSYVLFFVVMFYFRVIFFLWEAECVSCYVLGNSPVFQYRNLMEFVFNFLQQRKLSGRIEKRVMDTMKFQWEFDFGNYFTQQHRILDDLGTKLQDDINKESVVPTLSSSMLFKFEDENLCLDICRRSKRLALPANTVLITFGIQSMVIYIIHKGFVQLNSFLPKDRIQNVGRAITLKSGDVFPVVVALNQMPAAVNVRTVTDCELLVLDLEDFISSMVIWGVFKDIVSAIKDTDFSPMNAAKLGLSKVGNVPRVNKSEYEEVFQKKKLLGFLLRHLLMKKVMDPRSMSFVAWEFSRVACLIFSLFMWPLVFGCMCKSENRIPWLYFLLFLEIFSLVDFYIRLHTGFFNKKGIYVSHPVVTSMHYLSTSFVTDLISFIPSVHLLYRIFKDELQFTDTSVYVHIMLKSLVLYRFFGFFFYLKEVKKFSYYLDFLKYLILCFLLLNIYVSMVVRHYILNVEVLNLHFYSNSNDAETSKTPPQLYYEQMTLVFYIMMRLQLFVRKFDSIGVLCITFFALLGLTIRICLFSYFTLNTISGNVNFTTYQYYMKSFVRFLTIEKAEDKNSIEAIEHYEHEWDKKKGENLHQVFSRFPNVLHEDLTLPLYKNTFRGLSCFSATNEAFYRFLSRTVNEVYLKKGSVVIFRQQVQDDLFFIHKGQCFVKKYSKILCKGSLIGDIRRNGIMVNKIIAETHLVLLKIPSKTFFLTLINFHQTKVAFESQISNVEDFVESNYVGNIEHDFKEILTTKKSSGLMESKFISVDAEVDEKIQSVPPTISIKFRTKVKQIFKPNSRRIRFFNLLNLIVAYTTVTLIPIFIAIRILSPVTLFILYALDFLWILKITVTLRTAFMDPLTGNIISNRKAIFNNYLKRIDGLVVDVLSVLPFEAIPFIYFYCIGSFEKCRYISYCCMLRILRFVYIHDNIVRESKKLSVNFFWHWIKIMGTNMALINLLGGMNLILFPPQEKEHICNWNFNHDEVEDLLSSYVLVLNNFVGGGMYITSQHSIFHVAFQVFVGVASLMSKAFFVKRILSIMYVTHHAKSNQMYKLEKLEKYLMVRDVSPAIFKKIRSYFCDLMDLYDEESMPSFLKDAPPYIKVNIMMDLYLIHFLKCYIFDGIQITFLKQLAARLDRFIFFPGDYITEQGDVDHNMYFIRKGEIYSLLKHPEYPALELIKDTFVAGECFGISQGMLLSFPHKRTYRAKTLTEVLILNYNRWADLRSAFPNETKLIYARILNSQEFLKDAT